MLGKSLHLGKIFGIDLKISWSFLLLALIATIYFFVRSGFTPIALLGGLLVIALVAVSILAHELGHSLTARKLGFVVQEIELHFFGGAAKMHNMPSRPRDEILIAAAGPVVSFVLAGLLTIPSLFGADPMGLMSTMATLNLMLGAFNLVPMLPTDGGRILRAALTPKFGALEATRKSITVARVFTLALGIFGLVTGQLFTVAIAFFIWTLGTRELRLAEFMARRGGMNDDVHHRQGPTVEVFDRRGHFIGRAPGGVEEIARSHHTISDEKRRVGTKGDQRASVGVFKSTNATAKVLVQGADGRLYVITGDRYS